MSLVLAAGTLIVVSSRAEAHGPGRLKPTGSFRGTTNGINAVTFQSDIRNAVGEAMGCGGHLGLQQEAQLEKELLPMWRALPKNSKGRIERRMLRYLAHRYFNRRSGLVIRGFEPSRPVNSSDWGAPDILSQQVPAYVERFLESRHLEEHGFDINDAVHMVATLDQLIFDSETAILKKAYKTQGKQLSKPVSRDDMERIVSEYVVRWMLGNDFEAADRAVSDRRLLNEILPHHEEVKAFARGQLKAMEFQRQRAQQPASRPMANALSSRFTFEDAHEVVGSITKSFASYWESECQDMKSLLVEMDPQGTGRVPLSKFYGNGLDGEWRFGESEAYLRDMGVLDETSAWRGKQVIIPNYIQASSNCIVSTSHYLVCCINDCESLLGEIEVAIGSPLALPSEVVALVKNMTAQTTLDHDHPPKLEGSLTTQLEQIAATHGGRVPLHGRLFAQWMHYAFPQECPFPHKVGTTTSATPSEYGSNFFASTTEMEEHAQAIDSSDDLLVGELSKEETQWMSQWSEEEELISNYDFEHSHHKSFSHRVVVFFGSMLLACAFLAGSASRKKGATGNGMLLPTHGKSHFV